MKDEKKKRYPEKALLVISVSVLILLIGMSLYFDRSEGEDNEEVDKGPWNDLDGLKRSLAGVPAFQYKEVRGTDDLDLLQKPENVVYMLIGIEKEINTSNYLSIKNFIMRGGHVIVADDTTNANRIGDLPVLEGLKRIDFIGKPYLVDKTFTNNTDDRGYLYNKYFIRTYSNIRGGDYEVIVHRPNGLNSSDGGNYLLTSSKVLTVIDMNENEIQDTDPPDIYSPYGPIAVEYRIGPNNGGIVYFSSTGLFTDNTFNLKDNEVWFRAYLTQFLPSGGSVLLDTSKQTSSMSPHREIIPA